MSITRQNLSILIVTLKSEAVIHQCIKSINKEIPIIVVENSNNFEFKKMLENRYTNVTCILSGKNLGMGSGNNLGLKNCKSEFVLILNPDVILQQDTINELIVASQDLKDFTILSPLEINNNYPNFQLEYQKDKNKKLNMPIKVKSVDGFSMLLNKEKLDKIIFDKLLFNGSNYFDENFFMYLENDDLCKRVIDSQNNIYIVPKAKINHLGAKAVNDKFKEEVELSRNWHWIWSKFYYNKKHYGFLKAFFEGLPKFFLSMIKYIFYYLINENYKKKKYFNRASGFYNCLIGKPSWYRPNLDD